MEMERFLRAPTEDPLDGGDGLNNSALLEAQSIAKLEERKASLFSVLDGGHLSNIR